jgi:hypothetical protein
MTTTSRDDVLTIVLPDGRTLGYREYGDPAGSPCVYLSGTPASSAAAQLMDETAKEMGVRWIAVDKPGYGASTFQPERSLRSITGDVVALADLLGLQRFAVAGESGGGPWTLALAHDLHDRLTTAILIGGIGPTSNRSLLTGMTRVNRFHGELDTFVPIAIARDIARRVPNCSTDFRSDLGHLISVHRKEDILQAVLNA